MPLRTIDLCAGIGGIRKGFEMTGQFENILSAEIDKYACITYEHLYDENPYNDITSTEFKDRVEGIDYEVLLAGFPCQTFSRAGLEEGFNDERKGIIFNHIAEIIDRTRPRGVFLENVDNLIRHDNGNTIRTIINRLELDLNYKVIGVMYDENGFFTLLFVWGLLLYEVAFAVSLSLVRTLRRCRCGVETDAVVASVAPVAASVGSLSFYYCAFAADGTYGAYDGIRGCRLRGWCCFGL